MSKKKKKAKPKPPTLTMPRLNAELRALRAEVLALKESIQVKKLVKTSVKGPRRSEVFVDAQVIPMAGEFNRSGEREDVQLDPPDVNVDIALKGQIGTATTFEITINGKTKTEQFVTVLEKELRTFTYPFSDFGL